MHLVFVLFKKLVVSRIIFFSVVALAAVCGEVFSSILLIKPDSQALGLLQLFSVYTLLFLIKKNHDDFLLFYVSVMPQT